MDHATPSQVGLPQAEEGAVGEDSIASSSDVGTYKEETHDFDSYENAALGATKFIYYGKWNPGPKDKPKKVDPANGMWPYPSKANRPAGITDKIVGVGIKKLPQSVPIDLIRLDYDPTKGLHFNVFGWDESKQLRDEDKKFAAQFPFNPPVITDKEKEAQFLGLVQRLQTLTGNQIWDKWTKGQKP